MFSEGDERLVLVILSGNITADRGKLLQLLFHIFCWCLYVGLHPFQVLIVIHFCSGISNDSDVFWQKLVAILLQCEFDGLSLQTNSECATYEAEKSGKLFPDR